MYIDIKYLLINILCVRVRVYTVGIRSKILLRTRAVDLINYSTFNNRIKMRLRDYQDFFFKFLP